LNNPGPFFYFRRVLGRPSPPVPTVTPPRLSLQCQGLILSRVFFFPCAVTASWVPQLFCPFPGLSFQGGRASVRKITIPAPPPPEIFHPPNPSHFAQSFFFQPSSPVPTSAPQKGLSPIHSALLFTFFLSPRELVFSLALCIYLHAPLRFSFHRDRLSRRVRPKVF